MMTNRETFIPPPVLPAQAPTSISTSSSIRESSGQRLKSAVAKPVVVITDATWKKAYRRLWSIPPHRERVFQAISRVAPAMIPRYHRSSSLRRMLFTLPISSR